ncbi:MAG TPA: DUF2993 domain-containing protein [bacterium]
MTNPRGTTRAVALALVVIAVLIAIAAAAVPVYVQTRLAAALRASLGARRVAVTVRAGPRAALAGRFDRLILTAEEFRAGALPIQRLHADLTGVELDRGRLQKGGELVLRHLEAGTAEATVTEAGLQEFLASGGTLHNVQVRLAGGEATVRGTIRILAADVSAMMRGTFVIRDGRRVVFQVREISIGNIPLAPDIGRALSAAMNPLVTADDFPIPLRFTEVSASDGELVLRAEAAR